VRTFTKIPFRVSLDVKLKLGQYRKLPIILGWSTSRRRKAHSVSAHANLIFFYYFGELLCFYVNLNYLCL
jgi:hypothetical protein